MMLVNVILDIIGCNRIKAAKFIGLAKMKVAILAFLYYGQFVKKTYC